MYVNCPIAIIGPTAIGKSSIAISLAKKMNGEIIGLDSRQIYKGMMIGTAQPTEKEMDGIRHHLIGIWDPSKPISAGEYTKLVKDKIAKIQSCSKTPIICGGAGLYFRALTKGIFEGSVTDLNIRKELNINYKKNPLALLERLKIIDPEYGEIVHINNKKRLIRALEIYESTGKTPSEHFQMQKDNPKSTLDLFSVLICMEKEKLNKQIKLRIETMLAAGWVEEVKQLIKYQILSGLKFAPLDSIGYNQIQSYLKKDISFEKMKEDIFIKTRQFSRKQVQWFKKENINLKIDISRFKKKCATIEILNFFNKFKNNDSVKF